MPDVTQKSPSTARRFPVERDGMRFIVPPLALSTIFFALRFPWTGTVCLLLGAFCVYFFRDPERAIPAGDRLVLAPADGKVVAIKPFTDWKGAFGEPLVRISIFLSVFDVHVNRAPFTGLVHEVTYTPGRFMVAWDEAASQKNEQTLIRFASPDGDVWVKLIAGLIARRIVCRVEKGQKVAAGDRIGLIRFGSRVDCILPASAVLHVRRGQSVTGGSTILGVIP